MSGINGLPQMVAEACSSCGGGAISHRVATSRCLIGCELGLSLASSLKIGRTSAVFGQCGHPAAFAAAAFD